MLTFAQLIQVTGNEQDHQEEGQKGELQLRPLPPSFPFHPHSLSAFPAVLLDSL